MKADRLSFPELAERLAPHAGALAAELAGGQPTSRTGAEWRWRKKGSLSIAIAGPRQGHFFDFEAGTGGDALALVAHLRGTGMAEAAAWARGWLGLGPDNPPLRQRHHRPPDPVPRAVPPDPERAAKQERASRIWREGQPPAGTLVERYLRGRGLALPPDGPLRFHPACPRGDARCPAMVALMTDPMKGEPCGIHRTFITPAGEKARDATGNAKAMLGGAGVVRLVSDAEIGTGLGLAEGIETALAVMQRYGWSPVWAAGSAGGIGGFPVLPGIETLTLFLDADDGGASLKAAQRAVAAWTAAGAEVRIAPAPNGLDFADLIEEAA